MRQTPWHPPSAVVQTAMTWFLLFTVGDFECGWDSCLGQFGRFYATPFIYFSYLRPRMCGGGKDASVLSEKFPSIPQRLEKLRPKCPTVVPGRSYSHLIPFQPRCDFPSELEMSLRTVNANSRVTVSAMLMENFFFAIAAQPR